MARIVQINKQKLEAELAKRNLNASEVSRGCGYSPNYLAVAYSKARGISEVFVRFLQLKYNIAPETYVQTEEKKPEKPDGRTIGQEMILAIREQTEELKKLVKAFNTFVDEWEREAE